MILWTVGCIIAIAGLAMPGTLGAILMIVGCVLALGAILMSNE